MCVHEREGKMRVKRERERERGGGRDRVKYSTVQYRVELRYVR